MASLVSSIESALASVATSLPDAVRTMRHDAETGVAISSSSVELSGETVTDSGAVEKSHVIVTASDFPTLTWDALVYLADTPYIATSFRKDPVGASATVGLSNALSDVSATVSGARSTRRLRIPMNILAEDNGLAQDMTESIEPTTVHSWSLVVAVEDWPDASGPQIGDEFSFFKDEQRVRVHVSRVNRRERHFILSARSR